MVFWLLYGSGFVIPADENGTEILMNQKVAHDVASKSGERTEICVPAAARQSFSVLSVTYCAFGHFEIIRGD